MELIAFAAAGRVWLAGAGWLNVASVSLPSQALVSFRRSGLGADPWGSRPGAAAETVPLDVALGALGAAPFTGAWCWVVADVVAAVELFGA